MTSISAIMVGNSERIVSWKVLIRETRIGGGRRNYRGLTEEGLAHEPLRSVVNRAKAMHSANMTACGMRTSPYTEIVFINQFGNLIPTPHMPTPHP